jgi:hypothetical protein
VYGTLGAAETRATDGKGGGAIPVMTKIRIMAHKPNPLIDHPRNGYSSLTICISELDYCVARLSIMGKNGYEKRVTTRNMD